MQFITNLPQQAAEKYSANERYLVCAEDKDSHSIFLRFPTIYTIDIDGWSLLSIFHESSLIRNPHLICSGYGYAIVGMEKNEENLIGVFERRLK